MKSRFFKGFAVKGLILASALAFVNCDDSSSPNTDNDPVVTPASSASADPSVDPTVDPTIDPTVDPSIPSVDPITGEPVVGSSASTDSFVNPSEGTVVDPTIDPTVGSSASNNPAETPASSASDTPASSASVNPASSATVAPASSAAVTPAVSSSSVAQVPSSSSAAPIQEAPKGIFLATDTDENKNYMEVVYQTHTGDNGGGVLAYPKRLSDTQKHGVVLWGPGGGTEPTAYEGLIKRLASHGFVVIATSESPDGTGRGKPALDWLAKKNETPGDPLYQKLDMTKVGASGHSMGGLQSEQMLINDNRVITAVLNNSGAFNHAEATKISTSKSFAIVYGEGGMERPNAEGDYNNPNVKAPGCLIKMTGGQGNECQNGECGWGHGSGPWGGMAATVAWMRWHLGGEDFRKADFVGTSGKYINGPIIGERGNWKGQCKNF